jgi:hypothetical protein
MTWTSGFGNLAPGGIQTFWVEGFVGEPAQYIMANPLNPGGSLMISDFTKVMNNDGSITYWVTIINTGTVSTNFNLIGGSVS